VEGVTEEELPPTTCPDRTESGGSGITRRVYDVGRTAGTFRFTYNTIEIKDKIEILYEGMVIFTTGDFVGTNRDRNADVTFGPGASTRITVVVTGNQDTGTRWSYTVHCPQGSTPDGGTQPASILLILVPGIDPQQTPNNFNDAHERAETTFSTLLTALGCDRVPSFISPLAGRDLVVQCEGKVSWIPYSYVGVDAQQGILGYSGRATGYDMNNAVAMMEQIVAYGRAKVPGSRIYLIGHSLGGAVASAWAGHTGSDATVITLDSPVNGIWNPDASVARSYCAGSTGLLDYKEAFLCDAVVAHATEGLSSEVIEDLHSSAHLKETISKANAINFVNTEDTFVTSWFAANPASNAVHVAISDRCTLGQGLDFGSWLRDTANLSNAATNHGCILRYTPVINHIIGVIYGDQRYPRLPSKKFSGTVGLSGSVTLSISSELCGSLADNLQIEVELWRQGHSATSRTVGSLARRCSTLFPGLQGTNLAIESVQLAEEDLEWVDWLMVVKVNGTIRGHHGILPASNEDVGMNAVIDLK
jgi:hypothetical protein